MSPVKSQPVSRSRARTATTGDADWADPQTRATGEGYTRQGQASETSTMLCTAEAMHASEQRPPQHRHQPPDDGRHIRVIKCVSAISCSRSPTEHEMAWEASATTARPQRTIFARLLPPPFMAARPVAGVVPNLAGVYLSYNSASGHPRWRRLGSDREKTAERPATSERRRRGSDVHRQSEHMSHRQTSSPQEIRELNAEAPSDASRAGSTTSSQCRSRRDQRRRLPSSTTVELLYRSRLAEEPATIT
jgi:hypothetical protein